MKHFKFIISPVFMGILFVVFSLSMAVATFLENDFGSAAAYGLVYNTKWFELIFLLLAVNLVGQLIVFRLFKVSRLPGALFHLSFIIMLAGAAITRYTGWEGSIHIREGEDQSMCYTTDKYISYTVKDSDGKMLAEESDKYSMNTVSADNYKKRIRITDHNYEIVLSKVIPEAEQNTFIFDLTSGNESASFTLLDNNTGNTSTASDTIDGKIFQINYGPLAVTLPFSIRLNDLFLKVTRVQTAHQGYKSDVVLIDKNENVEKPFMIFMNNILKYKGYRFYQSSFDRDEKGTVLSVNHDMAGMLVTYTGYVLLFLFIILSLLNKNSVFHNINAGYWKSNLRKSVPV